MGPGLQKPTTPDASESPLTDGTGRSHGVATHHTFGGSLAKMYPLGNGYPVFVSMGRFVTEHGGHLFHPSFLFRRYGGQKRRQRCMDGVRLLDDGGVARAGNDDEL